jgi:hypothetical protein
VLSLHGTAASAAADSVTVTSALVTVVAIGIVVLPGMTLHTLLALRLALRRAAATVAAEEAADRIALATGRAVLRGDVVATPGSPVAAIRVKQQGTTFKVSGKVHHRWKEVSRKIVVRPFQLRLVAGQVVAVEPGSDVYLVDPPNRVEEHAGAPVRERLATIEPGQRIYAVGELTADRSGDDGAVFTLRAGAGSPLMLSVGRLEGRELAAAGRLRIWAVFLALCTLAVHGVFWEAWAATLVGRGSEATIEWRACPCAWIHTVLLVWLHTHVVRDRPWWGLGDVIDEGPGPLGEAERLV